MSGKLALSISAALAAGGSDLDLTKNSESLKIGSLFEDNMIDANMTAKKNLFIGGVCLTLLSVLLPAMAHAHGVSSSDAKFVAANQGAAIGPFMYLGANTW